MTEYRYMGVDLLTRRVVEDLPLYGVSLTRRISNAGSATGSFKLGTNLYSDEDLLTGSEPGRIALVAVRDDVVVWAGPIWSRTFQSQANVVSMTCQSYESIFSAVKMLSTFSRTNVDQLTIFKDLITTMQAQPYNNFGIDVSGIGLSGVLRSMLFEYFEDTFFAKGIEELVKQAGSFDYTLEPYFDANEVLQIRARTGYPYLGYGQEGIALDYPGQITNYYWPESAGRGGTRHTFTGKGEGTAMKRVTYVNQDLLDAGYPAFDKVVSDKSVDSQATIDLMGEAASIQFKTPINTPTIDLKLTEDIEFGEWNNVGVPVSATIEDARFPNQTTFSRRMLGWDLSPLSSESTDVLKLVLEGNDDA